MSQWLDMVAQNTIGQSARVDTSGVGLWATDTQVISSTPAAPKSQDRTMLYLTGIGVILAAFALLRKG